MDAEGPRGGARCADGRFAELCCADVARCTRQRLALPKAARTLYTASMLLNSLLCSRPLRGSLPVLCSRRRHRAVLDSWSRGFRAAVLDLKLPEAALSPPGRFTAEPPPEGWSSLYGFHRQCSGSSPAHMAFRYCRNVYVRALPGRSAARSLDQN